MKNLLLFFISLAMIGLSASSQSLSLSDENGPIPDNGDIYFYSESDSTEIVSHVYVTNNSANAIDVNVARNQISMASDSSYSMFCWYVCWSPTTDTSLQHVTIDPGVTLEDDFSGHYYPNYAPGEAIIAYTFYDLHNPDDKVTVNVHYVLSLAGLSEEILANTGFSAPYPNPSSSFVSFDYDIPAEANRAEILITNLLGAVVYEASLEGNIGTLKIDVSDFTEGIYFATLKLDQEIVTTQKVLVR
ncbi:MAG: T9SS type A sorting domain-containing protein [Bacteroidota bacterium]